VGYLNNKEKGFDPEYGGDTNLRSMGDHLQDFKEDPEKC
jgi:hypothetical protein